MTVPTFENIVPQNGPLSTPTTSIPTNIANPAATPPSDGTRYFTAEDIERARQEEKTKVYSRLDSVTEQIRSLQSQNEALLAEQNARKEAEEAARREADEAARAKAEAEMSAKDLLAQREQEWQAQQEALKTDWEKKFETFAQERAHEQALLQKEKELAALSAYTASRVADEKDNIAPQLLDFISGNSQEEIDAAIERAKAKSAEILAAIQEQQVQQRAQQRGVAPTGYAPVGPMDTEGGQRQYSAQDINNMSMQDYVKFRQQAGIGNGGQGRGLFG